jgi:tetratricopeptide (TPR) repeat protein
LYERAVLASRRFSQALTANLPSTRHSTTLHPASLTETEPPAMAGARREVLQALRRVQSQPLTSLDRSAVDALLAYHEGKFEMAREQLENVLRRDPLREELWEALARTEEAQLHWSAAESAYSRAIKHDQGYLPIRLGRCHLRAFLWQNDGAIDDASAALTIFPNTAEALGCRATARVQKGHDAQLRGHASSAVFAAAHQDLDEALRISSKFSAAWLWRGTLNRYEARGQWRHAEDPDLAIERSLSDLSHAISLDPVGPEPMSSRARTLTLRAEVKAARGDDATADLEAAEADIGQAIALSNDVPFYREWRGDLRALRARILAARDKASDVDFERAQSDLAASAAAGGPWAFFHRGLLSLWQGRHDARIGRDPAAAWTAAQADLTRALEGIAHAPDAWFVRAQVRTEWARRLGKSSEAHQYAAAAQADRAVAWGIDPLFVATQEKRASF